MSYDLRTFCVRPESVFHHIRLQWLTLYIRESRIETKEKSYIINNIFNGKKTSLRCESQTTNKNYQMAPRHSSYQYSRLNVYL